MATGDDHAQMPLENGYATTTPRGDNLAFEFVRDLATSWSDYARDAGNETLVDEELGIVCIDNCSPSLFLNPVVMLRPLAPDSTVTFTRCTTEFYGAHKGGPFGVWSIWPAPDLRPYGFMLGGHPPWMVRAPGDDLPAPPSALRIEKVHDDATAFAYETALVDGFPVEEMQPPQPGAFFLGDTRHTPNWHHYVGYVDDTPVASASAYTGAQLLRVDNVATLPDHRGRGYGAAITAAATATRPDLPAALLASDPGRPIYQRMGYYAMNRATLYIGMRPS
jgi:GNAT superfamily N-acetyltransferase